MNAKAGPGAGARRPVAEVEAKPAASGTRLIGGHLLAAISASIVAILRDHYGRGPMRAKTYALDDIVLVESKRLRSSPAQGPSVPQSGPRRARHHGGDLLRRRPA